MQKPPGLQMRAGKKSQPHSTSWFRIENAHVDEENSTDETTKIYIYDVIGDSWWEDATPASEFVKQLSNIHTKNIELHLNSPGGDIFDGVAIYNALKSHPADVHVVVDALAASAASFIAQAGDKITMTKAATMMIHDGSAMAWGPASVMRDTADLLDKLSNTVAEIYSDRAGQSIDFWRNLMIEETWYNSHEAVDAGLADAIGEDTKKEDDEKAQNAWDYSIFNYAGRGSAPDPFEVRHRIANRLKEMTVGRPTNQDEGKENPQETGSPEVDPNAQTTEGTAGETDKEREESENANPGAVPDPPTGTEETSGEVTNKVAVPPAPVNTAGGQVKFTVGDETFEMSAEEAGKQLAALTQFRNESVKAGKIEFVTQLARDGKIMAAQVEKMTNYALKLDDEGYANWRDTWEGAAANPMFQRHTGGVSNPDGPQSQAQEEASDRLEVLKETVKHHKNSGLSEEKIKATDSYKNLITLEPDFKL